MLRASSLAAQLRAEAPAPHARARECDLCDLSAAVGRGERETEPSCSSDSPARALRPFATAARRWSSPSPSSACALPCSIVAVPWPYLLSCGASRLQHLAQVSAVLQHPFFGPGWPMRAPRRPLHRLPPARSVAPANPTHPTTPHFRVPCRVVSEIAASRFEPPSNHPAVHRY